MTYVRHDWRCKHNHNTSFGVAHKRIAIRLTFLVVLDDLSHLNVCIRLFIVINKNTDQKSF